LAKTLGGGFPIGACLASDSVAKAFQPGNHASTFGGNPLACAAALATLDVLENEKLVENAATTGAYLHQRLREMKEQRTEIVDERGVGLMAAIEFEGRDATEVASKCLQLGLIVNPIGSTVLRFLPPLIVNKEDVDKAIEILNQALD